MCARPKSTFVKAAKAPHRPSFNTVSQTVSIPGKIPRERTLYKNPYPQKLTYSRYVPFKDGQSKLQHTPAPACFNMLQFIGVALYPNNRKTKTRLRFQNVQNRHTTRQVVR